MYISTVRGVATLKCLFNPLVWANSFIFLRFGDLSEGLGMCDISGSIFGRVCVCLLCLSIEWFNSSAFGKTFTERGLDTETGQAVGKLHLTCYWWCSLRIGQASFQKAILYSFKVNKHIFNFIPKLEILFYCFCWKRPLVGFWLPGYLRPEIIT